MYEIFLFINRYYWMFGCVVMNYVYEDFGVFCIMFSVYFS